MPACQRGRAAARRRRAPRSWWCRTLEAAPAYEAALPGRRAAAPAHAAGRDRAEPHAAAVAAPAGRGEGRRRAVGAAADGPCVRRSGRRGHERPTPATSGAVLAEVAERFHDVAVVASREAERRGELESIGALTVTAPALDHDDHRPDVADRTGRVPDRRSLTAPARRSRPRMVSAEPLVWHTQHIWPHSRERRATAHVAVTRDEVEHLQQLVGEWGFLADLCVRRSAALRARPPTATGSWSPRCGPPPGRPST